MIKERSDERVNMGNQEKDFNVVRQNNAAVNSGKKFFHSENDRTAIESLKSLGERSVVSEKLYVKIRNQFDWTKLRAFYSKEIKDAATAAKLTMYDSAHRSPFAEILVSDNQYALVSFEEEYLAQPNSGWERLLCSISRGFRPPLQHDYSALYFDDDLFSIPKIEFSVLRVNPCIASFSVSSFGEAYSEKDPTHITKMLQQQLKYQLPDIDMGEPIRFIDLEHLTEQEKAKLDQLSHRLIQPKQGVFFLASELETRN